MSAAEAPKSEQIQANVAAALSRLRGELGAASAPVASATPIPLPKTGAEAASAEPMPEPVAVTPLPAGPVRTAETAGGVRPFEPILNAMAASSAAASNDSDPAKAELSKPDLFGRLRADPSLATDRATAANAGEPRPDSQPDLLSGMEVPPAPPPPLGSFEAEDEVNGRGRRMRNRLLVLVALVVIAGGAVWAWVSSHRAPEGPVPVITADTTPEKVKPEDEGGMQVPNQNVEILNGQSTAEQQENVLPPPEQPVAPPTNETADQANAAPQAPAVTDAPKPVEPAPTTDQSAAPSVAAPAIPSVSAPEPGQTAAAPTPAPVVPVQTQQAAPAPAQSTSAPAATTAEKPAESAPAAEAPKAAEPTQTAAAPAAPAKPAVAPTAGGNARIQLAAVKSEAAANTQWAKLQKAYPDLLGALTLNVQKVTVNGGNFYRIQAGPLSKAQAKELCTKLKTQKQDCIVAK